MQDQKCRAYVTVPHYQPIKDVLTRIREHGGSFVNFDPEGPSGGNPDLFLEFPSEQTAVAYLREHYPDDDADLIRSLLRPGSN